MTDPSLAVSSTSLDELLKDQTDQSISTPQNHQPQHSTSRHTEAVSPTVNMEESLRIVVDRQENKDHIGPSNIDHVSEYLTKGRLNKRRKSVGNSSVEEHHRKSSPTGQKHGFRSFHALSRQVMFANRVAGSFNLGRDPRSLLSHSPGSPPGLDPKNDHLNSMYSDVHTECAIQIVDYNSEQVKFSEEITNSTLDKYLAEPRPAWSKVRWINVDGLSWDVLRKLSLHFNMHPLASEDVLHIPQKIKLDRYDDQMFISLILLSLEDIESSKPVSESSSDTSVNKGRFKSKLLSHAGTSSQCRSERSYDVNIEQVSLFYLPNSTILSFFDSQNQLITAPIMSRLAMKKTLIRSSEDCSFLLNSLIDTIVDHALPVCEYYSTEIANLEMKVLENPKLQYTRDLHLLNGELTALKRTFVPTQHVINSLRKGDTDRFNPISPLTKTYLNDVQDHIDTIVDNINTLQTWSKNLIDLIFNTIAYQTNESMKTLAVVSALFLPVTFLAGVYGTNFQNLPEIYWNYGYLYFWVLCILVFGGMVGYFKMKKWF